MAQHVIECVPNISEGRDRAAAEAIAAAAAGPGCWLIDISSDPDHNRTVITLVGDEPGLEQGVLRLVEEAVARIDLTQHQGAHPRMGAVDVIPFIPVTGATMEDCVALSRRVGGLISQRFKIPVFLYEESAVSPERRNLAKIRSGEFEGLGKKLAEPKWAPDFGSMAPHPTAGAVAVGAREFLVAFNVNLATDDLSVAKEIATAVRHSSGGLRYVKALGLSLDERGIVQVSMNLTNFRKTPVLRVFEMVCREAERLGVLVLESEIIGKVPRQALVDAAISSLRVRSFEPSMILEEGIEEAMR
ncbi:glutamate formimidoyltransferase [Candidatus Bipolaricaulota bacterium]|nr:glutamate formimidoyltransferase [Candidatus Bipolaricaulota bacterium]